MRSLEGFLSLSLSIFIFVISVTIHEISHGYIAYRLGDPTAKIQGRLTLNPIRHLDFFGSFLLPVSLMLMKFRIIIGWPKPVPVNFRLLQRKDIVFVALAGPCSNAVIALVFSFLFRISPFGDFLNAIFLFGILINLILVMVNLIPIPPLDGSRVIMSFLHKGLFLRFARIEPLCIIVVFVVLITFFEHIVRFNLALASILAGVSLNHLECLLMS